MIQLLQLYWLVEVYNHKGVIVKTAKKKQQHSFLDSSWLGFVKHIF